MLLSLGEREAHVWFVQTDAVSRPCDLQRFESVLSEDERERAGRFKLGNGQQLYAISHGFLRILLSYYAPVSPRSWRFTRNALGKPEIDHAANYASDPTLSFNLSHTTGLAACVIARDREVGVDAEDVTRRGRKLGEELVRRCLSPAELSSLGGVPEERRGEAFFDYWTLKEAYLKARGFGLMLPLEGITFSWPGGIAHEGAVSVSFDQEIRDDPRGWQFERFTPTTNHKVAVAVRRFEPSNLTILSREFTTALIT